MFGTDGVVLEIRALAALLAQVSAQLDTLIRLQELLVDLERGAVIGEIDDEVLSA